MRPFEIHVSDDRLVALHHRLDEVRWPFVEDGGDADAARRGPSLALVRALRDRWRRGFDWRALEARVNRHDQWLAEIDGLTVHCLHARSARADAVPLLIIHGWPSSYLEFLDLLEPLAAPAADQHAFHVVTPSIPGYGFSTTRPGIAPQDVAPLFVALMERLGYHRFIVQGGDWGSMIGTEIARQFPDRVIGLHLNCVNGSVPADPDVSVLSEQERQWTTELSAYLGYPHFVLQTQAPDSIAYALNDSPVGLAAWIGEKLRDWIDHDDGAELPLDTMLRTIALYWFTGTIGSSCRLYWEMAHRPPVERYVTVPTAGAIFPKEVAKLPRSWAERLYNIVQWHVFDRGGHFPALEVPDLLIDDLRQFARRLQHRHEDEPHGRSL